MNTPAPNDVRRALVNLRQAGRGIEQVHEDERPEGVVAWTRQTFERAADDAIEGERQARDLLADMVKSLAGPAPCALIVDGEVIVVGTDDDGMAVVPADRVVRL